MKHGNRILKLLAAVLLLGCLGAFGPLKASAAEVGTLEVGNSNLSGSGYTYTWDATQKKGTLELENIEIKTQLSIQSGADVTISTKGTCHIKSISMDGSETTPGSVTFSGPNPVTVGSIIASTGNVGLTVEQGADVTVKSSLSVCTSGGVGGKVTVNGALKILTESDYGLMCGKLHVGGTGSLTIDRSQEGDAINGIKLMGGLSDQENRLEDVLVVKGGGKVVLNHCQDYGFVFGLPDYTGTETVKELVDYMTDIPPGYITPRSGFSFDLFHDTETESFHAVTMYRFSQNPQLASEYVTGSAVPLMGLPAPERALAQITNFKDTEIVVGTDFKPDPKVDQTGVLKVLYRERNASSETFSETAPTAVGKYEMIAVFNSLTHYGYESRNLDIVKPLSGSISQTGSLTYNGKPQKAAVVKTFEGHEAPAVKYGTAKETCDQNEVPDFTDAGSYTVYYQTCEPGYQKVTGSFRVTIAQKPLKITANNQAVIYGGEIKQGIGNVKAEGLLADDMISAVTLTADTTAKKIIPSAAMIQHTEGSTTSDVTDQYDIKYESGKLEVLQAPCSVVVTGKKNLKYETDENGAGKPQVLAEVQTPAPEGCKILYARSNTESSVWSDEMPYETDAGEYTFWYKVQGNENYKGLEPVSITVTIGKADPQLTAPSVPSKALTYNRGLQYLLQPGSVMGGELQYRLGEQGDWQTAVPQGQDAKTYQIWYRVQGDQNYKDIPAIVKPLEVTIQSKKLTQEELQLNLDQDKFEFDQGPAEKKPNPIVKDGDFTIPDTEYEVEYQNNNAPTVNAQVIIKDKPGGNYELPPKSVITFEILDYELVDISVSPQNIVYGDPFTVTFRPEQLESVGRMRRFMALFGGKNTASLYLDSESGEPVAELTGVTLTALHTFTVDTAAMKAKIPAECFDGNTHTLIIKWRGATPMEHAMKKVSITLSKCPVVASIPSGLSKIYDGKESFPEMELVLSGVKSGDTVTCSGKGTLNRRDVGTATCLIPHADLSLGGKDAGYYKLADGDLSGYVEIMAREAKLTWTNLEFTYDGHSHKPIAEVENAADGDTVFAVVSGEQTDAGDYTATVTSLTNSNYSLPADPAVAFTIRKAKPAVQKPRPLDCQFDGQDHPLVQPGSVEGGTMEYSLSKAGPYSTAVPVGREIKTYEVWYRVVGDKNHESLAPERLKVYIFGAGDSPRTADTLRPYFWATGLTASAAALGIFALLLRRRKRR